MTKVDNLRHLFFDVSLKFVVSYLFLNGNGVCLWLWMAQAILHNTRSELQTLVHLGLPLLRDDVERKGKWWSYFVERTFDVFLSCGDVRTGFAWLECMHCPSSHTIIPFSCGSRGFCPTCGGRTMVSQSMRWVNDVFPKVPVRQCVLS
jgi:hypothetical protein